MKLNSITMIGLNQGFKQITKHSLILLFAVVVFTGCDNDSEEPLPAPAGNGDLTLDFDAFAGGNDLILNSKYTNATGEDFTITMFQYYVSNIKLIKENGDEYSIPMGANEGYYLIKTDRKISLSDIPSGNYTGIEFMVGVDSSRSTMAPTERQGDLDIGNAETGGQMYWSWNSGYIFMRFEGIAEAVPDSTQGLWVQDSVGEWYFDTLLYTYWNDVYNIHVGGFGGYDTPTPNNSRKVHLHMHGGNSIQIQEGKQPEVHITADALKVMDGAVNHSFSKFYQEHSPMRTGNIANNMQNMFSIHHVHNQ